MLSRDDIKVKIVEDQQEIGKNDHDIPIIIEGDLNFFRPNELARIVEYINTQDIQKGSRIEITSLQLLDRLGRKTSMCDFKYFVYEE